VAAARRHIERTTVRPLAERIGHNPRRHGPIAVTAEAIRDNEESSVAMAAEAKHASSILLVGPGADGLSARDVQLDHVSKSALLRVPLSNGWANGLRSTLWSHCVLKQLWT
jgi:hypothetical protein